MNEPQKQHWLDAWQVDRGANLEYEVIDGIRGLAILGVVACHFVNAGSHNKQPLAHFINLLCNTGGNGVMVFFGLSGFLISLPFWKRKVNQSEKAIPPGYGGRRFWKIYPPLALSVVVIGLFYSLTFKDWSYLSIAGQWLSGWGFVMPTNGKLSPVLWSLAVEAQFYIALPIVFLLLRRASVKVTFWGISLAFLVAPVLMRVITGHSPTNFPEINTYFPAPLDSFYLGIMLAGLVNLGVIKRSYAQLGDVGLILLVLTLLAATWASYAPATWKYETTSCLVKISTALMLCFVANPDNPRARILSTPWLRWVGIISYEWYLFHAEMISSVRHFFPTGGNMVKYLVILVGSTLLSLAFSALVYRYFSLPILKFGRSQYKRRSAGQGKPGIPIAEVPASR